jgi:preprotein translocase subunit SecD
MVDQSRLLRIIFAPIMFWIVFIVVGLYLMVSIDKKMLREPAVNESVLNKVKRYASATSLSYVKKGIDLAGGVYLILGVEVEEAIKNRLNAESRSLDHLFKTKEFKSLHKRKEIKQMAIEIDFADEESAKSCYHFVQENRAQVLRLKRDGTTIRAALAPDVEHNIRTGAVEQAVSVLNNRLSSYGVEGISVLQHGERQIVVQLPGVDDPDRVRSVVTKTAQLEFKLIEQTAATREALLDKFDGELPSDKMIVPGRKDEAEVAGRFYLVSSFPDMSGERIVDARVEYDQFNKPSVSFRLDGVGAKELSDLTSNNVGRNIGIIIDNVVFSAPVVKGAIPNGHGNIENMKSQKESFDLSIVLKSGSFMAPLKPERENVVGATLGQDSISKGLWACLIALLMVFLFSLVYYKIPGLLAMLAILFNLFLILMILSYFGGTLTLPGIAGMTVTIGMAIDTSILIYEDIKDRLSNGMPLRTAVNEGFKNVMPMVLDSNITTFLTGLVLFQFGGPAIKGFAVTLMAGIVATILAGIYFLKSLFTFLTDVVGVKRLRF